MNRFLLGVFLLLATGVSVSAQDIIIKTNNDTIRCKIQQVNEDNIQYAIQTKDMLESNTIPRRYVDSFFTDVEEVLAPIVEQTKGRFRFALAAGYAYRLGKVIQTGDISVDAMSEDIVSGFGIEAEVQMFFDERYGIGLNLNHATSSTNGININVPDYGMANQYKESQQITYIGPAFACRYDYNKFLLTGSVGLGALIFRDKIKIDGMNFTGKATTLGMNLAVGAEYKFSSKIAGGLKLSETIGSINEMSVNGVKAKSDGRFSLSTIMILAYISFSSY